MKITAKSFGHDVVAYGKSRGLGKEGGPPYPFLSHDPDQPATANQMAWEHYFREHLRDLPERSVPWLWFTRHRRGDYVLKFLNVPTVNPADFDPTYQQRPTPVP